MQQQFLLYLLESVTTMHKPDGPFELAGPQGRLVLKAPSPGIKNVIAALPGGETEVGLEVLFVRTEGSDSLPVFYYMLAKLRRKGLVGYGVKRGDAWTVMCEPMSAGFALAQEAAVPDRTLVLSRFAITRREGARLILESPLCTCRLVLHDALALVVLHRLAAPVTPAGLQEEFLTTAAEVGDLVQLFYQTGFAVPVEAEATAAHRQWEVQDLWLHYRSRMGGHDDAFGASFRFIGEIEPLPALKPPMSSEYIELFRPDIEKLIADDYPFTLILEERQSLHDYGKPITLQQVGEFLYRAARMRALMEPDPSQGLYFQSSRRSYPSGGIGYELELYLTIGECDGLAAGLYHYQPLEHRLYRLSGETDHTRTMLQTAGNSTEKPCTPQVLISLAARFPRVSWKYSSIAYSVILKNVGVLYQTMYLVATAMDLAPCAIGSGSNLALAQAAGLDPLAENAVGAFLLGTKRISS